jgi:EAL domain-containing protein (putative c-di-GMP-specific phosphodiesterase class I)
MRTNLLTSSPPDVAWLERNVPGEKPERIELSQLPFTLGRNESCDYQIVSSRVSRVHAEITREAGVLKIHDLKSTNGTFVNGERIEQHRLADGDLVVIAEVQFCLRTNQDGVRNAVTQVMLRPEGAFSRDDNPAADLLFAIRRLQESILHRAARICFHPVCDLIENRCLAYEADVRVDFPGHDPAAWQILQATECRLVELMSQLHRLLAAEQMARLPNPTTLIFKLQPAEIGADSMPQSLSRLTALAGKTKIVVEIPESAVVDIPYFRDFLARLQELDIGVAYGGFTGSLHQLKAQASFAPDYLKLAPALVRGLDKSTQRQQQMKALVEAARETGIQLIAVGIHSENEAGICRELGFRLAEGDYFNHTRADWSPENLLQCA